jgi:hypothetical protein
VQYLQLSTEISDWSSSDSCTDPRTIPTIKFSHETGSLLNRISECAGTGGICMNKSTISLHCSCRWAIPMERMSSDAPLVGRVRDEAMARSQWANELVCATRDTRKGNPRISTGNQWYRRVKLLLWSFPWLYYPETSPGRLARRRTDNRVPPRRELSVQTLRAASD